MNISIDTRVNTEGQYACELSVDLESVDSAEVDHSAIRAEGMNRAHAIATALEQLASRYRHSAGAQQAGDWDTVERSADGKEVTKRYHVILHYERLAEDISKFEAMHNTIMGNTVVENAVISVIEIAEGICIEPIAKVWRY